MFGRKQASPDDSAPPAEETGDGGNPRAAGKGRPTPKRRDQEAARKRPLVPKDRKEAARNSREAERAQRAKVNQAMITGDDRYLPVRDKGPQRRYVRDIVDSRTSVGEFFMPLALLVLLLGFIQIPSIRLYANFALYVVVALVIIDGLFTAFTLRRRLKRRFETVERGVVFYGVMRNLQFRRIRLPKPQVKRGRLPED